MDTVGMQQLLQLHETNCFAVVVARTVMPRQLGACARSTQAQRT